MSFMTRIRCALIACSVIIAPAALGMPAMSATAPKGTVVVARVAPTGLLIWDASPAVGDLMIARQTGEPGMRMLAADALDVLVAHAPSMTANSIAVRVQYVPTGVVGAAYNAQTFAAATPLMIVTAGRTALLKHASAWRTAVLAGQTPAGVSIERTGAFPTPQ
jgi:hypothetical protein